MRYSRFFLCSKGQSTVEYVVIVTALIAALMGTHSVFSQIQAVLTDKYKSYCFGVSISDPPSMAFDEQMENDSSKVMQELQKLEDFIEHPDLPTDDMPSLPDGIKELLEKFKNILKEL